MRRPHVALISVLALGAVGLAAVVLWASSIPTRLCDEGVARPSDWIYAGLFLFAVGLPLVVFVGTTFIEESPRLQRLFVAIALAEGIGAVAIVLYLNGKYSHYECG
jgi:hypothetical protein